MIAQCFDSNYIHTGHKRKRARKQPRRADPETHSRCDLVVGGKDAPGSANEWDRPVNEPSPENASNLSSIFCEGGSENHDSFCPVCELSSWTDDNKILLCDGTGCRMEYHQLCLSPPMLSIDPSAKWYCPKCENQTVCGGHPVMVTCKSLKRRRVGQHGAGPFESAVSNRNAATSPPVESRACSCNGSNSTINISSNDYSNTSSRKSLRSSIKGESSFVRRTPRGLSKEMPSGTSRAGMTGVSAQTTTNSGESEGDERFLCVNFSFTFLCGYIFSVFPFRRFSGDTTTLF
jgi:hypothetical protein